ncbi:MAG: putative metal-binding motif-containing protein [Alphaproteobacteria bacterium]|nr:putative metal-binding motif-containing protein [Alphaproteobacteria bacterium]
MRINLLSLLALLGCKDGAVDTGEIPDSDPGQVDQDGDGDGVPLEEDCDDTNPSVYPGNAETPYDGLDNDCDPSTLDDDLDGDGAGYAEDCDDADAALYPGAEEACDGVDQDCDGAVDEGVTSTWYADVDADGYGDPESPSEACAQPEGQVADSSDCDDTAASAYPGGTESCDELDNDCDGSVDEAVTTTYYADLDGDGHGDWDLPTEACDAPTGYAALGDDCDDSLAEVNPDAEELCNGLDDDCDGAADEDDAADAATWYADADGDGYGDASAASRACEAPSGSVDDDTDCDDSDAALNPDTVWYLDFDADGYGGSSYTLTQCEQPNGYLLETGDCDDADSNSYPGAAEVCDGADNDCDGNIDDGAVDAQSWYDDLDGDGYGDAASATLACEAPSGAVADDTDCDDGDSGVNPGALEACDGVDTDCDGDIDEDEEVLGADAACAASSCLDIVTARTNSPADGDYWIDVGSGAVEVACDMSVDSGGWTLLLVEHSQSIPSYGSSWFTSTTPAGSLADITTSYKADVYGDLDFEELLYVVFPASDPTDRIEVGLDFGTTINGLDDGFSSTRAASSATVHSGTLAVQASPYTWAFRGSCSGYGGGAVMLGAGHGNTCNIFYGFGCTGGTYCGVSDFYTTWMASNTNRYYPSGATHTTFGDVIQLWVR